MKNIIINWVLPTIRQLGGPLPISQIRDVEIELSADAGASFSGLGFFLSDQLSTPVNDLPFSDQYMVRGRCFDTADQSGGWVVVPFTLADNSPPGDLSITIEIL